MMKEPNMLEGRSVKYAPRPSMRAPLFVKHKPQPPVHPFCLSTYMSIYAIC